MKVTESSSELSYVELEAEEMAPTDVDQSRSEANIREWRAYLPADCVQTMIGLGWDLST
jgi:hypothetical protein